MVGAPRFGKMSTGIRFSASIASSAMAATATRMVTGRRSAKKTKRIRGSPSFRFREELVQVARCRGHGEQRAPDVQLRQAVVDFRLCEHALGVRDFDRRAEPS